MLLIGSDDLLLKTPSLLSINGKPYIITNTSGIPKLFSAICPHQHGTVLPKNEKMLQCPNHNWTFDPKTGKGIFTPQSYLKSFEIIRKNGKLYAELNEKQNELINKKESSTEKFPKITLVTHASLLIEWDGFNLLTDPWIEGPAFFGSWTQYPPSNIHIKDLPKIDAIWISHEHSDHFHAYSLSFFDKTIPIFVNNSDDNRLVTKLKNLNFTNVIGTSHSKKYQLADDIFLTTFNSGSVWNDSILYLELGNFSILNTNDAGINWELKDKIDKVDLICSAFSWGASGYPLTWTHLTDEKKLRIMQDANQGMLKMHKQLIEMFSPDFFLPMASFGELYSPKHIDYMKMRRKNSLLTVKNFLQNENVKLLDLIPGEKWLGNSNIIRRKDRDKFFQRPYLLNYLKRKYSEEKNNNFHPTNSHLNSNDVIDYFTSFSDSILSKQIGNLSILFSTNKNKNFLIKFKDGKVACKQIFKNIVTDMTMSCPSELVQEIIKNDLSWDEAHIGYWCKFSRYPDLYNISLWRLLHAPWQGRKKLEEETSNQISKTKFDSNVSIANIIEIGGKPVIELFEKYGLYCSGCNASLGENIIDGCKVHGLNASQTNKVINELQKIIDTQNSK